MDSINFNYPQGVEIANDINRYNNVHFPSRTFLRQGKLNKNTLGSQKSMKNNAKMRKHHRIQQPGFDVQRFGHK